MDKLSRDSTAAIKAGMSYGKYMAMKNPVKITPPKPEVEAEPKRYVCEFCGKEFWRTKNYRYKFCSEGCKEKYQTRKEALERQSQKEAKICVVCGKEFVPRGIRSKYCSYDCRYRANLEHQKVYLRKRRAAEKNGTD